MSELGILYLYVIGGWTLSTPDDEGLEELRP